MLPSSEYKEGQFLLMLDNPVTGGSYTCKIPQASASSACLHGNNTQAGEATVTIDQTETRLLALEARQGVLMTENNQLKDRLAQLEVNHTEHTGQLHQDNSAISQQVQDLGQQLLQQQQNNSDLYQQVQDL